MNTERPNNDNHDPDSGNHLPRREFLRRVMIASASTLFLPAYLRAGNGGSDCVLTSPDILGPYYKANAPYRVMLVSENEPGEKLIISGVAYANDCVTPVPGVLIDVWGANDQGCYDNLVECTPRSDDTFNLRGRMLTNDKGEYSFTTIKPGRYLNGGTFRPSHLHFRITAPGASAMITQLYFEGDPYIPTDPWASDPDASMRIIPLNVTTHGLLGIFNLNLDVEPGISSVPYGALEGCRMTGTYPNPFHTTTTIGYEVASPTLIHIAIYDTLGRQVRSLVKSVHGAGKYIEEWDGLDDKGVKAPSGMYTCRFQAGTHVQTGKLVRVD